MNKFLYIFYIFLSGSLIASEQKNQKIEPKIVYQEEGSSSSQDVSKDDNVYQEALDLYNKCLEIDFISLENPETGEKPEQVTLLVEKSTESIFISIEYPNNVGCIDSLRMDGIDRL